MNPLDWRLDGNTRPPWWERTYLIPGWLLAPVGVLVGLGVTAAVEALA